MCCMYVTSHVAREVRAISRSESESSPAFIPPAGHSLAFGEKWVPLEWHEKTNLCMPSDVRLAANDLSTSLLLFAPMSPTTDGNSSTSRLYHRASIPPPPPPSPLLLLLPLLMLLPPYHTSLPLIHEI